MLPLSLLSLPAATAQDDGAPYGEVPTEEASGDAAATNPHTTWTRANDITLTFDPARSAYAKSCSDMRHVQVLYWMFRAHAVCADGPDCGTWYEGLMWTFTTTAADARARKEGTSLVFNPLLSPGSADEARQAFERYARAKGFTSCK